MPRLLALLFVLTHAVLPLSAEEGMWLPTQLDELDLQEKGLLIPIQEIYDPTNPSLTDAVVWLGGCSASFVSAEGLILTNHHCAYSALQRSSTVERNLLRDGFLAGNRDEEIPAVGFTASVLDTIEDITDEVLTTVGKIADPVEYDRTLARVMTSIRDAREGGRKDVLVEVANMFEGNQFLLFRFTRYRDVRLVYAPPLSVGKYGGEIDNWMWPRHTGDFAYLRAYMAPDGSGASFSLANVPVRPRRHLRISRTPLKEGDFTFILGFPGRTTRYRCSPCVRHFREYVYPEVIRDYEERLSVIDSATRNSDKGVLALASTVSGINNSLKKTRGVVESMHRLDLEGRREAREQALREALPLPEQREEAQQLLQKVSGWYAERAEPEHRERVLGLFRGSGAGVLPSLAFSIYNTARQREMSETVRDPEFSERGVTRTVERLPLRYYGLFHSSGQSAPSPCSDKGAGTRRPPMPQRAHAPDWRLMGSLWMSYLDRAFAATGLTSMDSAAPLYQRSRAELEQEGDPLLDLAALLFDDIESTRRETEVFEAQHQSSATEFPGAVALERTDRRSTPMQIARCASPMGRSKATLPEMRSSTRPFTTLSGAAEKSTGEVPFDMPVALRDLSRSRDFGQWADPVLKDVPVAFTHALRHYRWKQRQRGDECKR